MNIIKALWVSTAMLLSSVVFRIGPDTAHATSECASCDQGVIAEAVGYICMVDPALCEVLQTTPIEIECAPLSNMFAQFIPEQGVIQVNQDLLCVENEQQYTDLLAMLIGILSHEAAHVIQLREGKLGWYTRSSGPYLDLLQQIESCQGEIEADDRAIHVLQELGAILHNTGNSEFYFALLRALQNMRWHRGVYQQNLNELLKLLDQLCQRVPIYCGRWTGPPLF